MTMSEALARSDAKYDYIKFFLSLLVMAIHTELYPMALYPWLRIAVPLFFIISSYFLFSKMQGVSKDAQKQILKKFVLRNLGLYLSWFVILLPITLYVRRDVWFSGSFLLNLLTIVQSFFFASTFIASWFIAASVLGVLVIHWLCKLLREDLLVLFIAFASFCLVTLASSYSSVIAGTAVDTVIQYINFFVGLIFSFPAALLWVSIGKLCAEQKLKIKSWGVLIFLILCYGIGLFMEWRSVMSLDGTYDNDSYFTLAPLCIFLFLGIQKIKPFYREGSLYFRRASTVIYVLHGSAVPVIRKGLSLLFHIDIPLLTFVLTLICCLAVYALIELANKKFPRNQFFKMLY